MKRREFVGTVATAAAVAAIQGCAPFVRRRAAHPLVIRNGFVFDGIGSRPVRADVAIDNGRITAVRAGIAGTGMEEINAQGLAVAPGFIDIHSHGDGNLEEDPRQESVVRQGVTTIVVGQDGSSRWPRRAGTGTFTEMLDAIDKVQPSVNVASMVGLGTVRGTVVGDDDRLPTSDELVRMIALVEQALAQGACGASTGLEYTPGAFAKPAELAALCEPLAKRGLPYATHMRNEDDDLLLSIAESIDVARAAKCPLQISHLKTQGPRNWNKLDQAFKLIGDARTAGMDVALDRYPYIAYQTGLSNLFPTWSRDGGTAAFLARLDAPDSAARIKSAAIAKVELIGGWDNVLIASARSPEDRAAEGKRLGAYAASINQDPYALTVAMLKRNNGTVGMVGFAMSEDNLDRILAHPYGMVCSDGGAFAIDGPTRRGSPHPRGAGSFPRVISRYVRERKALSLPQAIRKMTGLPASRVKLDDRGRIAPGMAADIIIFDPATIGDTATYEQPFSYPVGINAVIVNGVIALRDGQRGSARAGRALRV